MILDELPTLGYLGFVSQALVLGAGYGMKILAVFHTTTNVGSESMGTSQQSRQGQINQNTSQQSSITQSMTHRNLLTKSEITNFGSGIVLAFYNECPPIICRRLNYLVNKVLFRTSISMP
jgi:type IV secretory pathway TraG/TraD family ATPase VirD4